MAISWLPFVKSYKPSIKKTKRVGISIPTLSPFTYETSESFMNALRNSHAYDYQFVVKDGENNKEKLYDQIDTMIQSDIDMLFTIGATSSLIAQEIHISRNKEIPIVFGGVKHPEKLGLIGSKKDSITGVTGISLPFLDRIQTLLHLRSDTKKVLIPYSSNILTLQEDRKEIESIFSEMGIESEALKIESETEIEQKLKSIFQKKTSRPDVIMTLRDNAIASAGDSIAELCNEYGVMFFSSHRKHLFQGAACTISENDEVYGIESARLASLIMEDGLHPSKIEVTKMYENFYKLMINSKTMRQQGLDLDTTFFREDRVI